MKIWNQSWFVIRTTIDEKEYYKKLLKYYSYHFRLKKNSEDYFPII